MTTTQTHTGRRGGRMERITDTPRPAELRRRAKRLIVAETGCRPGQAEAALNWLQGYVKRARAAGYVTQYPTDAQMAGIEYSLIDRVMEHGAISTPDSAHDALEKALLKPELGELALKHDTTAVVDGQTRYCTFSVVVEAFAA